MDLQVGEQIRRLIAQGSDGGIPVLSMGVWQSTHPVSVFFTATPSLQRHECQLTLSSMIVSDTACQSKILESDGIPLI